MYSSPTVHPSLSPRLNSYYGAYLAYFHDAVPKKGIAGSIEEYIFSEKYNIDPHREAKGLKQAEMLNRFVEILALGRSICVRT